MSDNEMLVNYLNIYKYMTRLHVQLIEVSCKMQLFFMNDSNAHELFRTKQTIAEQIQITKNNPITPALNLDLKQSQQINFGSHSVVINEAEVTPAIVSIDEAAKDVSDFVPQLDIVRNTTNEDLIAFSSASSCISSEIVKNNVAPARMNKNDISELLKPPPELTFVLQNTST